MPAAPPPPVTAASHPLRVAGLARRLSHEIHMRPDAQARAALAEDLDLLGLRKLEFRATLTAEGRADWRLEGILGATAVQGCVVTGAPVTTRVDIPVLRRFLAEMPAPSGAETEIPEDDSLEPLGPVIDPGAVMREALALALPDYPRAEGAALPAAEAAGDGDPDGGDPDRGPDEARPNPFAALAGLKARGPEQGGQGGDG